jgi:hypothetical protein
MATRKALSTEARRKKLRLKTLKHGPNASPSAES